MLPSNIKGEEFMSVRFFCRTISIGIDLRVMPTQAKNLSSFRKCISTQPQVCRNANPALYGPLNIQRSVSQDGETKSIEIVGLEKLEEEDVLRLIDSLKQVISNHAQDKSKLSSTSHEMSFDEFLKSDFIESYEKYKADPNTSILIGDDEEKILDAYEGYCIAAYGDYMDSVKGSCPFTAL